MTTNRTVPRPHRPVRKPFAPRPVRVRSLPLASGTCHATASRLKSARAVRGWLGLSLAELCHDLERLTGRHVGRSTVSDWESGRRKPRSEMLRAYAVLIANRLTAQAGREIAVRLTVNSPWRVEPWAACRRCGRWMRLRSAAHKLCQECRA